MSYADVITSGISELEYFLAIEGIRYVLGTSPAAPGDAWYTAGGYSYLQGLRAGTIRRTCAARPGEVWPDLSGMDIEVDDPDETLASYLRHLDGCGTAELTQTLAAGDLTAHVNGIAQLPAVPGPVYIDREAMAYAGTTPTTLTGLARGSGVYGSVAVEHYYSADTFPPCRPVVSSGPGGLRGRRAVIYAAQRTDHGLSACSQIWVGVVDGEHTGDGMMVRIPLAHCLSPFVAGQAGGGLPAGRVRGLYVPNLEGLRYGRLVVSDPVNGDQTLDLVADGDADFFDSGQDMVDAFVAAFNAAVTDWSAGQLPDGRMYLVCNGTAPAGSYVLPAIMWSGLLFKLLGFVEETESGAWAMSNDYDERFIATRAPAKIFAVLDSGVTGFETRLYLESGEASMGWVESYVSIEMEQEGAALELVAAIDEVNAGGDYLVVRPARDLGAFDWPDSLLVFGDDASGPTLRQLWLLDNFRVDSIARALWSGTLYSGESWGYTVPPRWRPEPCLRDGDVDWDALRAIVSSAPAAAARMYAPVKEPRRISDILAGPLLACGVYAYVREDGVVSWRRTALPALAEADATIDGSVIDADEVLSVEDNRQRDRVVNVVRFRVRSAGAFALSPERTVLVVDNQSIQAYGARPVRLVDELGEVTEELTLDVTAALSNDLYTHGRELARHMAGPLRLLGAPLPSIELPVTISARAYEIGDAVLLTSRWVRSPTTGLMGVAAQLCLVMGWERVEGYDEHACDRLDLWLVTRPAAAIAPAALATAYDVPSKTFTFADDTLFKRADDASDLSYFEAGDVVELIQYDDETPDIATGVIDSVNVAGKTVTLAAAYGGTLTLPAIMRFRSYSLCTADQKAEGWAFACDDADGELGTDPGQRWG